MVRLSPITLIGITLTTGVTLAQVDPHLKGWEALHLGRYEIASRHVYVEAGLESLLPAIRKAMSPDHDPNQPFLKDPNQVKAVLATINGCLGIDDPNLLDRQRAIIRGFGSLGGVRIDPLYLVRQKTTKDLLRSGASLPGFRYDPNDDTVTVDNNHSSENNSSNGSIVLPLTIPLADDPNLESITTLIRSLEQTPMGPGEVFHEVTELALVMSLHPAADSYLRWFNEGVANIIAHHVLAKYAGPQIAEAFLRGFDPNPYRHLEKQLNLRYWPTMEFGLLDQSPPLKKLQDLSQARYNYATAEVKRLADRHSLDVLTQIIQSFRQQPQRGSKELFQTIQILTGEDLEARFHIYQDFPDLRTGAMKYMNAFKEAKETKNAHAALLNLQYLDELMLTRPDPQLIIAHRQQAAILLNHLDHAGYAHTIMKRSIDFVARHAGEDGRRTAEAKYVEFAIRANLHENVKPIIDRWLEGPPDEVRAAHSAKMLMAMSNHDITQAQHWARRVVAETSGTRDSQYSDAQKVLAIDPNTFDKTYGGN